MHAIEPHDAAFALSLHRFFVRLSSSAVSAFIWIILYVYFVELTDSPAVALMRTLLLYALTQTVTMLAAPLAMKIIGGNMLRGLVFGTLIFAAALVYTGSLAAGHFPHGAAIIGVLLGLYRAFYRAPYEMEHRAAGSTAPNIFFELLIAGAPLIAGAATYSLFFYPHLLFAAAAINVVALLPLLFVLRVHESYSWTYRETFLNLMTEKNQLLVLHAMRNGAFGATLFLLWPLAFYFLLSASPLSLGAAFSATLFFILFFRFERARVLAEQHADGATYVDEYTVLKEVALAGGRLAVSLIAAVAVAIAL